MATYPSAIKKLIPPGANDPRIKARVAILHVDAGNCESLYDYFAHRSGGIESHFFVKTNGVVEQYRDTDFQADANYLANDFAISIETQGFGDGEWTPAQLDSIKGLLTWLHETHGIPLQRCPQWDGAGVGYHIQFGSPGKWTNVSKSCPGPKRIRQFEDVLVPWMAKPAARPRVKPKTRGKDIDHAIRDARRAAREARRNRRRNRYKVIRKAVDAMLKLRGR